MPLRVGDEFAGWRIAALLPSDDALTIRIARGDEVVDLDLQNPRSGRHSPFPVRDGALYYRETKSKFESFEDACRLISSCLCQAMGKRSFREAFAEWLLPEGLVSRSAGAQTETEAVKKHPAG